MTMIRSLALMRRRLCLFLIPGIVVVGSQVGVAQEIPAVAVDMEFKTEEFDAYSVEERDSLFATISGLYDSLLTAHCTSIRWLSPEDEGYDLEERRLSISIVDEDVTLSDGSTGKTIWLEHVFSWRNFRFSIRGDEDFRLNLFGLYKPPPRAQGESPALLALIRDNVTDFLKNPLVRKSFLKTLLKAVPLVEGVVVRFDENDSCHIILPIRWRDLNLDKSCRFAIWMPCDEHPMDGILSDPATDLSAGGDTRLKVRELSSDAPCAFTLGEALSTECRQCLDDGSSGALVFVLNYEKRETSPFHFDPTPTTDEDEGGN